MSSIPFSSQGAYPGQRKKDILNNQLPLSKGVTPTATMDVKMEKPGKTLEDSKTTYRAVKPSKTLDIADGKTGRSQHCSRSRKLKPQQHDRSKLIILLFLLLLLQLSWYRDV